MEVVLEVCDICKKKHGIMLKRDGMTFGDRECFLDFCNALWLQWEREEFEDRGLLTKKTHERPDAEFKKRDLAKPALVFKPRAVNSNP